MAQQTEFNIIGNLKLRVDDAESGVKRLQSSISKLKMPADFGAKFTKSFSSLDGIFSRFKTQLDAGFNSKADVSNITKITKEMDTELNRLTHLFEEVTGKTIDFKVDSSKIVEAQNRLKELVDQKNNLAKEALKITVETGGKSAKIEDVLQGIQGKAGKTKAGQYAKEALEAYKTGNMTAYIEAVEKLEKAFKRLKDEAKITADVANGITMGEGVKAIARDAEKAKKETKELDQSIEDVKNHISGLQAKQLSKAGKELQKAADDADKLELEMRQVGLAAKEMANSSYNMSKQLGDLQQSTQYFFSLRNMINLLKQGIDQAVESVKNLDKAMTETAVVTDFSVADMWKDLPKYTKLANELGATTQGAYETMTLYYQQGLDQQATFEIGAETMKMARIAGLDYAKTTDMMTAALRGFNMELNEVSAQRINDVYSNLAAKTASDTREIGEAMERTASIAHSAGMSFEGTAAFLAQMIETTREAPENLGTAMKTIVARFQELKKNPLEISEVDGEEVNFNKIDAALKTIGVDLVATNGQFRNLDEVFLDISKRWGSLTQMQQRYIATVSAGSRQQSRFIAMMGNYDRTMELMDYANESAGASQEQFNKTLDSFEAKMNKLQNAWQQFTMGIANNTFVKGAVDGVTLVIDTVNNLIDTLSGGNGVVKSFLSIFTAFTGLKFAGRAMNGLIGGLGGMLDPTTKGGFGRGMQTGAMGMGASRITTPIVNKLGEILNAVNNIKNRGVQAGKAGGAKYEDRYEALRKLTKNKKTNILDVQKQFSGLDQKDQLRLFHGNRGTMNAIQRAGFQTMNGAFKDNPKMEMVGKTAVAEIFKGMANNQIKPEVGLKAIMSNPVHWGRILGTETAQGFSTSFKQQAIERANQAVGGHTVEEIKAIKQNKARKKALKIWGETYRNSLKMETPQDFQLSSYEKLANAASGVGNAFIGAGQSLSSFGAMLAQIGGPIGTVGSALQSLGGIVTSAGMAISGIGSALAGLDAVAAALGTTLGAIATPVAIIATVAVGAAAIAAVVKKSHDDIKKEAEKIADTYDKTTKKIGKNVSTLKEFQGEWERLSKGVDSNGMNVSLEQADYDRYQEIVAKIAEINPEIIEGFNAQGKAIITNNKALEETLKLLDEQERKATKEYTSDVSLKKTLQARDLNKDYKKAFKVDEFINNGRYAARITRDAKVPLENNALQIVGLLENQKVIDEKAINDILSTYDTSIDRVKEGEAKAINNLIKNRDAILSGINDEASIVGEEATNWVADSLTKPFDKLSKDAAKFDKAIQPTIDLLVARVTDSKSYEEIAPEMRSALMSGLEGIAGENKGFSETTKSVNELTRELSELSNSQSEYAEAMKKAEEAQNDYAESLDLTEYTNKSKKAIDILTELMNQYSSSSDSYSQAIADLLNNQIEKITNFTEEGLLTLTESLNVYSAQIKSAESAFESFQEKTKTDFSTGAENMRSIYDEITKETEVDGEKLQLHMEGKGDNTFWEGMESLMGEETTRGLIDKYGDDAIDHAKKKLKEFEPILKEGEEGAWNFWNTLLNSNVKVEGVDIKDGILSIDDNVNPDAFHELAEALGMSDDFLASMLSKLRQFTDVDLTDAVDVRRALATDEAVVQGRKEQDNGKRNLYVKDSYLNQAMDEAGIAYGEREKTIKDLQKQGIQIIPSPETEGAIDTLADMGITDMASAIQVLGDTGLFGESEIEEYAKLFKGDYTEEGYDERFREYQESIDHPELQTVQSIEGTVQQIYSVLSGNSIENGQLNETNKLSGTFKDSIRGREGNDTVAEQFRYGKNADGSFLTATQYNDNYKELNKEADSLRDYINQLNEGKKKLEGELETTEDPAKVKEIKAALEDYDAEIKASTSQLQFLSGAIVEGTTAFQQMASEAKTIQAGKKEVSHAVTEADKENPGLIKAYHKEGFTEDNKLNTENFGGLMEKVQSAFKQDRDQQTAVLGQYLQNQSQALLDSNANNTEISQAINQAAAAMKEQGFKPQEITDAINRGFGTHFENNDFDYETGKLRPGVDLSILQEQLEDLHGKVSLDVTKINLGTSARGRNNSNAAFHRVGTMARGSRKGYTIPGRPTLMGEEGEEVVWEPKRNEAYVVGSNGPQFGNISKDAVVWNAQQTKKIKKNSNLAKKLGTGARGISRLGTMAKGAPTGGGAHINGMIDLDAMATVKDVVPPEQMAEIPVKAKLEVSNGENGGSLVSKIKGLFGGGEQGPSIGVTANITNITKSENVKAVDVIGRVTKLTNNGNTAIDATAKVTSVFKAAQVAGEPIQVNARAKVSTVTETGNSDKKIQQVSNKASGTKTMTVDADTGKAKSAIDKLVSYIENRHPTLHYGVSGPGMINVPIYADFRGPWEKKVTIKKAAKGMNNRFTSSILPKFGSAAKGYGKAGPKGRGGLTLTGEEGYEIAWLPNENRSMILGANGPQMLELPSNAVVYTHEQSKKILKQKSIPAGSYDGGTKDNGGTTGVNGNNWKGKYGNNQPTATPAVDKAAKQVSNDSNTTKKKIDKATQKIESDVENATKTVKRVSVYWDNMARKLEGAQRIMERSATNFEKYIKEMRATLKKTGQSLSSGGGGGDKYIDDITHVLGISKKMNAQAKKELRLMDKRRHKDIKGAYGKGSVAAMEISYEGYKKNKKGKKEKVTKTAYVNTAGYIKYDKNNRTYVIDQKALNKIDNKSKRQAVADELNKRLDERIKQRNGSQDGMDKAKEALDKMSEELYKTFFAWESELTVIWELTQKIASVTSQINRNKSYGDLLEAQFDTGYLNTAQYAEQMVSNFATGVKKQSEKITLDGSLVKETQQKITDLINQTDDKKNLAEVRKKLKADTDAQDKIAKAQKDKNKADKKVEKAQRELLRVSATGRSPQEIKKAQENYLKAKKEQKAAKANLKKTKADVGSAKLSDTERMGYEKYRDNLKDEIAAKQEAWKYLNVTRNADGTLNIDFDQEGLEEAKSKGNIGEDRFKIIQDYVKELEEESKNLNETIDDLNTGLTEQYTALRDLQEDWYDYANQLWEISEEEQKNEIENFKKLSDSIKDSMQKLLDGIKNKLDERRQKEDNANTERDISQKMQRLALLRADTSGGHAVEIAQLEKEIADAQQNYERTLEDQLLDKLQKQAELAAEQRERVIELEEAILESSNNAAQVNAWMANPKDYENEIREGWLKKNYPDYDKMPTVLQAEADKKWDKFWVGLTSNQEQQKALEEAIKANTAELEEARKLQESLNKKAQKVDGGASNSVSAPKPKIKEEEKKVSSSKKAVMLPNILAEAEKAVSKGKSGYDVLKKYASMKGVTWVDVFEKIGSEQSVRTIVGKKAKVSKAFKDAFRKKFKKEFATGGVADFTGPAWLDGTPSKPELVLNAADTKNFLALKDVLSRAVKAAGSLDESSGGDATYEININVDHINNDYDVDKIAKRVGKIITTNSSYRNVTQVRNLR